MSETEKIAAVLVGQRDDRRFSGNPAYWYVLDVDGMPRWDEREDDPLVRVKLFDPTGRFTYYATAYSDDDGHRYLTGYCVSPLGPDCDEHGDMGADDVEAFRGRFGLPLERDVHFDPIRESELRRKLAAGDHV